MATAHAPGFSFLMVSAERVENTPEENAFDTELMAAYLRREGVTYDRCLGQYDGTREVSFRVCLDAHDTRETSRVVGLVQRLARRFLQESVLLVCPDGEATLVYADRTKYLGQWSRCDESDLQDESPDFTRIGDEYFIVEVL